MRDIPKENALNQFDNGKVFIRNELQNELGIAMKDIEINYREDIIEADSHLSYGYCNPTSYENDLKSNIN